MRTTGIFGVVLVGTIFCVAVAASADYVVEPMVGGGKEATVNPGETVDVIIILTSDAGDISDAVDLDLSLSSDLDYVGYEWQGVYNGSPFDASDSPTGGPHGRPIHFENFSMTGSFGEGHLLTVTLGVPLDYMPVPDTVTVGVVLDGIVYQGSTVPAATGDPATLLILEPGTMMLLGLGAFALIRRRRG